MFYTDDHDGDSDDLLLFGVALVTCLELEVFLEEAVTQS